MAKITHFCGGARVGKTYSALRELVHDPSARMVIVYKSLPVHWQTNRIELINLAPQLCQSGQWNRIPGYAVKAFEGISKRDGQRIRIDYLSFHTTRRMEIAQQRADVILIEDEDWSTSEIEYLARRCGHLIWIHDFDFMGGIGGFSKYTDDGVRTTKSGEQQGGGWHV